MRLTIFAALLAFSFCVFPNFSGAVETITYSVSLQGIEDKALKRTLLEHAKLSNEKRRTFVTPRALRRHVDAGLPLMAEVLRSRGYYAATQVYELTKTPENAHVVKIDVRLGPQYTIAAYDIQITTPGEPRNGLNFPLKGLGFEIGDPALSATIVAADTKLLSVFGRSAYPLAKPGKRRVVVDHQAKTLSVMIAADIGPYLRFGNVQIEGLENVDRALVERNLQWIDREPFDTEAIEKTRRKLRQTGLFSSVLVRPAEQPTDDGTLDVQISLKERKHRSIGVGGSYSTSEGALGKIFWEHRNLWGEGERLRVRGEVGEIRRGLFGDLRINDFMANDQNLVIDGRLSQENPDGFDSTEAAAVARLERRFSEIYVGSAGLGLDWSEVDENGEVESFTFVTTPLTLRRDTSDSLLDPSRGGRDTLTATPNIGIVDTDVNFVSSQLFSRRYFPLLPDKKLVLAGWVRLGTIVGDDTEELPANKRLYAGGAGSVRGYSLNSIGPLDAQNDPIGGRSLTEFGGELRWRITGPFGAVAFVEAGGVYDGSVPEWGKDLQWGAGLGARYNTAIGPLRLDVAVPLNRRDAVDDAFQILVSLGQAF